MQDNTRPLAELALIIVLLVGMASCTPPGEPTAVTEETLSEEARSGRESGVGSGTDGADETADRRAEHRLLDLVHAPWVGDLDGMLERRLIRVLILPSSTMYFLERGKPMGIVAEFQAAFEAFINKRFPPQSRHLKTSVVVVPTSRDDLMPALVDGRGDIAASSLTITPGREARVDFSEPVAGEIKEIVVTGPSSPTLVGLDDLAGREVLARRSSSYWEHLEELNERFGAEGKKPVMLVPAPEQLQDEDLMEMVSAGLVAIIVVDDFKAELWAQVLPDLTLHSDIVIKSGGRFGWMMRKESPLLQKTINAFINEHKAGTSFGNTVIRRYLGSTRFVKGATSPGEVRKFDAVVDVFRRYGERYDLDPLLLMAQGYQESGLDQGARSSSGAVGIMQVLPSTGKELNVGDIRQLEPNIHAGTKYIRRIIDTYFADDVFDDLNKMLFAFAAYNAGPNRIGRLRKTARERGLDAVTWFGNVELVVAEKVGAEPVAYVSNIFKYYVAFKLLEQDREAQQRAKESFQKSAR
jgi:membrane-bound lytic murein transglycosylase MltF